MASDKEFQYKISKALTNLALDWPFFASIGLTMERKIDRSVPVAATDGRFLVFNPEGFMALSDDEARNYVLLHEVTHVILKHPVLKMEMMTALGFDFEERLFQKSGDYAVNNMLVEAGAKPAPGALLRQQFKGLTLEEIYMKLVEEEKKQKPQSSPQPQSKSGPGGKGDGQGSKQPSPQGQSPQPDKDKSKKDEGPSDKEKSKEREFPGDYGQVDELSLDEGQTKDGYESELDQKLVQAESIARAAGSMPGNFSSKIAIMIRPKMDWRNVLSQVLFNEIPMDYTHKHPHKVFLQDDVVVPTLAHGEGGDVVLGVDTSGSISDEEINLMFTQFLALRQAFPHVGLHIVFCDTQVAGHKYIGPHDNIEEELSHIHAPGRGGTYFDPVFRWMKANVPDAKAVIYLTDGCPFEIPRLTDIDCPIIWVLTMDNDNWRNACPRGEITLLER